MATADTQLEVDQDLEFQRRDWTFERIGWIGMLLIVLAALVGLFGHGPAARAETLSDDHSLRIQYGRFERRGARSELTVFVRRDSAAGSAVSIWINDAFLRGIQLEEIDPEPVRQLSVGDKTLYDIAVAGDSARLTFAFTPRQMGKRQLELGIMGREPVSISQFVYP